MYQSIKVTLQQAAQLDGKPVTMVEMRPPTSNDVLLAQQQAKSVIGGQIVVDEGEHEAHLFANLTNTTREFIGSLQFYDYTQLQKAYDCFLLPLQQYAAKCALLFPSSAEGSPSTSSEDSALQSSVTG